MKSCVDVDRNGGKFRRKEAALIQYIHIPAQLHHSYKKKWILHLQSFLFVPASLLINTHSDKIKFQFV